ncbi:MAG: hypothetical protein EFT35_09430 [Methanophagales archaeon ANME-1-THS]|nr:MAG: hypothetical protein EFT35_09430 [Methanophagales archaeon ANME-1-THS]
MKEEELNSDLLDFIEPIRSEVKGAIKNFGSPRRPSYSTHLEIEQRVREDPDLIHKLLTETGIISRETIPFTVVSNFRGSIDGKPFYSASILHEGSEKRYRVMARDTGGILKLRITYEPVIDPEEMRLLHPADFSRLKITVREWELHNYRHHFILLISSKRYESFDIWVKASENFSSVRISLYEAGLREKRAPCLWYLRRLLLFKGLENEVKRTIAEFTE